MGNGDVRDRYSHAGWWISKFGAQSEGKADSQNVIIGDDYRQCASYRNLEFDYHSQRSNSWYGGNNPLLGCTMVMSNLALV